MGFRILCIVLSHFVKRIKHVVYSTYIQCRICIHTHQSQQKKYFWMKKQGLFSFHHYPPVIYSWLLNNSRSRDNDPTPRWKSEYNFWLPQNVTVNPSHLGIRPTADWERVKSRMLGMKERTRCSNHSTHSLATQFSVSCSTPTFHGMCALTLQHIKDIVGKFG